MALWTNFSCVDHTFVFAVVSLIALQTISLVDFEFIWIVSACGTEVLVLLVNYHVSNRRTPASCWTGSIVSRSPFTDVARLAPTTVSCLSLFVCNTHSFEWTRHGVWNANAAVLPDGTLVSWWVWIRISKCAITDKTSSAFSCYLTSSAVVCRSTIKANPFSFKESIRAIWLAWLTTVTNRTRNARLHRCEGLVVIVLAVIAR